MNKLLQLLPKNEKIRGRLSKQCEKLSRSEMQMRGSSFSSAPEIQMGCEVLEIGDLYCWKRNHIDMYLPDVLARPRLQLVIGDLNVSNNNIYSCFDVHSTL